VKILSKITLTAMVIGFALFFWSEKIFLMEKEQKVIVSDESKMEAIHEMEDKKRRANLKEIKENTPTKLSENEMKLVIVNYFKRNGYLLENSKEIIKEEVKKDNTKME